MIITVTVYLNKLQPVIGHLRVLYDMKKKHYIPIIHLHLRTVENL